jgi:hypothetical protein
MGWIPDLADTDADGEVAPKGVIGQSRADGSDRPVQRALLPTPTYRLYPARTAATKSAVA